VALVFYLHYLLFHIPAGNVNNHPLLMSQQMNRLRGARGSGHSHLMAIAMAPPASLLRARSAPDSLAPLIN
ncbi:hypothetical protein, partial [Klebsiella michiganensis]